MPYTHQSMSITLILDLDDTIFRTKSMDMAVFDPARQLIEDFALEEYGSEVSNEIIEEMKKSPFDVVANKYQFPDNLSLQFYEVIQSLDYDLSIEPFEDYDALRRLNVPMYLVTTGMPKLQKAKVAALDIANDFVDIFIDNPFNLQRKYKAGIFRDILEHHESTQLWVVGDNPNSELKAGKDLGMNTIQRIGVNGEKSVFSDYVIHTFHEIEAIVNGRR